jgi:serine protease Do
MQWVLLPYSDPGVLGMKLDPEETATVERVAPDSIAERASLRLGDNIEALAGQPLLSIADLQSVLHKAPASTRLPAQIRRGSKTWNMTLELREGVAAGGHLVAGVDVGFQANGARRDEARRSHR